MRLSKAWLTKWGACSEGAAWFENFGKTKSADVMDGLLADKKLDWANWLIVRILDRNDRIRYAVYAVEQVIDLFEKKYPEEKRPRQAIEAAKAVLKKNNKEARGAAWAAARAADDAAYTAWAAGSAWSAAWVAWVAGAAAREALDFGDAWAAGSAWSADWVAGAAAREAWGDADAMKEKIIRYGLKLHLKGGI